MNKVVQECVQSSLTCMNVVRFHKAILDRKLNKGNCFLWLPPASHTININSDAVIAFQASKSVVYMFDCWRL